MNGIDIISENENAECIFLQLLINSKKSADLGFKL